MEMANIGMAMVMTPIHDGPILFRGEANSGFLFFGDRVDPLDISRI